MSPEPIRLLKANAARGLGARVAFNFEDMRQHCEEYLAQVRQQAQQILDDARRQAESLRQQTYEQAQAAGREAGLQDADREIAQRAEALAEAWSKERMSTIIPALESVAQQLQQQRDQWLAHWEACAIRLCAAISEKIVRQHLAIRPESATGMIAEALRLSAGQPQVSVRMHPDDVSLLGPQAEEAIQALAACSQARVVADAAIARGGCIVETKYGTIDARLEQMLERITDELLHG